MSTPLQRRMGTVLVEMISPLLVILMIASLMFFLVAAFYHDIYRVRLSYILGLFTIAAVLISRISIMEGASRATFFGIPLAAVTLLATTRFVSVSGWLAPFQLFLHIGFIGLVWWAASKLTWDCTLVDSSQDVSSQGMLQRLGWGKRRARAVATEPQQPEVHGASTRDRDAPQPWWKAWLSGSRGKNTPGKWIIYFSLIALPLFGLGQCLIPDPGTRSYTVKLFVLYMMSGLGLLLITSLIGLQRYLIKRDIAMPNPVAVTWVTSGAIAIIVLLLVAGLLPRPATTGRVKPWVWLTAPDSLRSSRWAVGNDGPKKEDSPHGPRNAPRDNQPADPNSPTRQRGSSKDPNSRDSRGKQSDPSGRSSKQGASSSQSSPSSNQQKTSRSQSGDRQNKQQSSSSDSKGAPQRSQRSPQSNSSESSKGRSDQQKNRQPNQKNEKSSSGSRQPKQDRGQASPSTDEQKHQQQEQRTQNQGHQSSQAASNSSKRPSSQSDQKSSGAGQTRSGGTQSWSQMSSTLFQGIKWLFYLALAVIALFLAWKYRAEIRKAWNEFLDELRQWWSQLFAKKTKDHAEPIESTESVEAQPMRPFASFSNPFTSGLAGQYSPDQLVTYSFAAVEAWARERRCGRQHDETPHEFARQIGDARQKLADPVRNLADLYCQVAYAPGTISDGAIHKLRPLWDNLN